jgi:hypothetical protein
LISRSLTYPGFARSIRSSATAFCVWVLLLGGSIVQAATSPVEEFHKTVEPILSQYCYDCHGQGEHKGGVTLDEFKSDGALVHNPDFWWKVLKNVRAGIMPPQKNDRPTEEQKQTPHPRPMQHSARRNQISYQYSLLSGSDPRRRAAAKQSGGRAHQCRQNGTAEISARHPEASGRLVCKGGATNHGRGHGQLATPMWQKSSNSPACVHGTL